MPLHRPLLLFVLACASFAGLMSPGLPRRPQEPAPEAADAGEALLSELACTACHRATAPVLERLRPKIAPRLGRVGDRVTPQYLRRLLQDPQAAKPGTTMPDLLAYLEASQRADTIEDLVHYLASLGGPIPQDPVPAVLEQIETGRQLFHSVGCVSCHAPEEAMWELAYKTWEKDAITQQEREFNQTQETPFVLPGVLPPSNVPLGDLARKTTVSALSAFLLDPLHVRPSGLMPGMKLEPSEATAIARYLLRAQRVEKTERVPGLAFEYYELRNNAPEPRFEGHEPKRRGIVERLELPKPRAADFYGFRFSGFLEIEEAGTYRFFTNSDDGSRLFVDGKLVVQNDGKHAMVEKSGTIALEEGLASIEVTFYEFSGGDDLQVRYQLGNGPKTPLPPERLSHFSITFRPVDSAPFTLDPRRVRRGREAFDNVGCAACHTRSEEVIELFPPAGLPALAKLSGRTGGCLSPATDSRAPRFGLDDGDRQALTGVLGRLDQLAEPEPASRRIDRTLRRLNCYGCHRRGDQGGTHPLRKEYFKALQPSELGDSERIPPELTGVGSKLRPAWLRAVLLEGATAHGYMATRMPVFGEENVGHLPGLFAETDAVADVQPPEFTLELAEKGRELAGVGALGCIRCHTFAGYDSLGIPGADLVHIAERINYPWFRSFLLDPNAVIENTRMPRFWEDGKSPAKEILDGDPERQIDALWAYHTLRETMPFPKGVKTSDSDYELTPVERPILVGVFMKDVSPRTVMVGYPERIHFAYDVQRSRLAKVWQGRFFNARGTWHARAGALEQPAGRRVLDMPAGPSLAVLPDPDAPWPAGDPPPRVLGRNVDAAGVPSFRYELGGYRVCETVTPIIGPEGPGVRRRFVVEADRSPALALWLRLSVGNDWRQLRNIGTAQGPQTFRVAVAEGVRPVVFPGGADGPEVRVPLETGAGPLTFEVNLWW